MFTLVFTMMLYGMPLATDAARFETKQMCDIAAQQLSGPNWVGTCREPQQTATWCGMGTTGTSMTIYGNAFRP